MKKPMMPSAAMPPETESPMIEPVLKPLSEPFDVPVGGGAALDTVGVDTM